MTEQAKPTPDWERIEADYRAGIKSVREIASEQGVSHTAIAKRAKAHDWTRDLAAKVRAKADALVAKQMVASEVSKKVKATESETIEVEAQVQARIRLTHRKDLSRSRELVMSLWAELEDQTVNRADYERLGEIMTTPEEETGEAARKRLDKLKVAFDSAISLAGRTDIAKKLAEAQRILFDKERESYGIDVDKGAGTNGLPLVTVKDYTGRQ